MQFQFRKTVGLGAAAAIFCGLSMSAAHASCTQASLTGTWYAGIVAEFAQGGGWTGICTYKILSNGTYTTVGLCTNQSTGQSAPMTDMSGHGTLKVNSKCEISGVMSASGLHDTKVTSGIVQGGYAFISGARDKPATQVRLLTMIRKQ